MPRGKGRPGKKSSADKRRQPPRKSDAQIAKDISRNQKAAMRKHLLNTGFSDLISGKKKGK